jgi:hypothetical protein
MAGEPGGEGTEGHWTARRGEAWGECDGSGGVGMFGASDQGERTGSRCRWPKRFKRFSAVGRGAARFLSRKVGSLVGLFVCRSAARTCRPPSGPPSTPSTAARACACACVGLRQVFVRVRVAVLAKPKRLPNAAWIATDFCAAAIRRSTTTARRLGGGPAPAKAQQQKATQQSPQKGPKASAPPRRSGSRASRRRSRSGRGDPASTRRVPLEYPWSTREYP